MASLPKFPHRVSSPPLPAMLSSKGAAEAGVVTRAAQDAVDAAHPDELVVAVPQQVVIATEAGEGVVAWPADQDIVVLTVEWNERELLHAVADEDAKLSPPSTRSLPPSPQMMSSPPRPRMVSSSSLPTMTSSPAVPTMVPEPTIVAGTSSPGGPHSGGSSWRRRAPSAG